jgi:membrane protein YqaA with SNARE-associated domain
VGFPVFLLVTWEIVRGVRRQPERLESPVRKWLTYIALVITASTVIGDVVTFLAYFLRGDLDTRFVLKVVTVPVIAGGVFAYYLDSLRRDRVSSARNRSFALAAAAMVGFGVVVGFLQIGSPAVQRSASEDTRRLSDLSSLAQLLHGRWLTRGQKDFVLPTTIRDLQRTGLAGAGLVDPVNGRTYGYAPLQGTAYRLCAEFSRPSTPDVPGEWRHPAGTACFALDASENVDMVQRQW